MIQHRECGVRLKYRADPEDTEGAGSDHGAYRRVERMTACRAGRPLGSHTDCRPAQRAGCTRMRTAAYSITAVSVVNRPEKARRTGRRKNRGRAAKRRQPKAEPENPLASAKLSCGVVLAGKGGRGLAERRDDIICKIFKIHGDGAPGDRRLAKTVDRCLHENICEAKYCALYSGRKSNFQDLSGSTQRELRRSERKAKQLVLRQPVQHQNRREDRGNIGRNGDTGNAHPEHDHEKQIEHDVCDPRDHERQETDSGCRCAPAAQMRQSRTAAKTDSPADRSADTAPRR